jgi:hypothetical protein
MRGMSPAGGAAVDIVARPIGEVGEHDLEDWVALALG